MTGGVKYFLWQPHQRFLSALFFAAILFSSSTISFSQTGKSDLEKQRDEINEKIATTKKLIRESESEQKLTNNQLAVLTEQIRYREELLRNISSDIRGIEGEIARKDASIGNLTSDLDALKKEYAGMIYHAYKNRSAYDKLMFIFSAEDFYQAYKRFKMIQHYAGVRKKHVANIEKTQREIKENIHLLQKDKRQKEALAGEKEKEKKQIDSDKHEHQSKLSSLKVEEKKLRLQQKKQEDDRKKLTAKIKEIIAAEIEAERKKEEIRRAASASATSTAPASSESKKLELAPEVKIINADFEKNRGSLPWPVSSGVVTSHFGRRQHESIAGIEVNNNGIDFTMEKDGAVLATFEGKVSSVFAIPGAGLNIIITHGSYKTVYSGLATLQIKVGDMVEAGQKIGTVMYNGEGYILHFEIWKVSTETGTAQNPELWMKKR
ncbi:MAG: peptidoglycan DD-metalloendopeptidase family protein [Crocinitomicaceae bacterium]|nr:peptidoglycan DD-metalloendopeptidase family protein [Crocinitomicaceae bacterium]